MTERVSKPRVQVKRNTRTEVIDEKKRDLEAEAAARDLGDELDDVLDEIDSVLEENAQEFLNSYVQKGGE